MQVQNQLQIKPKTAILPNCCCAFGFLFMQVFYFNLANELLKFSISFFTLSIFFFRESTSRTYFAESDIFVFRYDSLLDLEVVFFIDFAKDSILLFLSSLTLTIFALNETISSRLSAILLL